MAGKFNFFVNQGEALAATLTLKLPSNPNPANLTGYTAQGAIKKTVSSPDALAAFTIDLSQLAAGQIGVGLAAPTIEALCLTKSYGLEKLSTRYVYDLILFDPTGAPFHLLEGELEVRPSITRFW